ncbi:MAG: MFS transporter [Chloroflexi bacterium]|nr:MFS transporter [Chloroflexota bacterium]MBU1749907.1 MFS transporter [Chloroflexota bacterium]MBU1879367.1 MFS transporter [Chloroflexota bacterium]
MTAQQDVPASTWDETNWKARFFAIWSGQAGSLLGSMLVQFALVWWLTSTTGSATVLAVATLVALLPGIVLGPLAGTLVDRWNRRAIMIVADGIIALATLLLAYLFAIGAVQIWHVYVLMFVRSLGGGFHWPAMQASTSLMVPEKQLSRVAGLNQTLNGLMNIASPPLGALLMTVLPIQAILAIDVVTAAFAIVPLLFISIPQPVRRLTPAGTVGKTSVWVDFREGLRYVWGWPGLLAIIVLGALGNLLFNPAFSLLPILVTDHFGGQAPELGWIEAVAGIGVVTGGLLLSVWGGFKRRVLTMLMGFLGIGAGILVMALAPASAYWLALGGMFIVGAAISMVDGPVMALLQANVEPEMQGRVFTLMVSAVKIASPLSLIIAGPVADWLGVRVWYWIAGVGCLLLGVGACFIPAIINLEKNNNGRVPVEAETPVPVTVPGTG